MNFAELRKIKEPTAADLDRFIEANEFPLVSPGRVIFIYRGPAESVRLRQWIYGLPADPPMYRLGTTDMWYLENEVPDDSRFEYKFEVVINGETHWLTDPLNPFYATDPFGANSVCRAWGYERPDWSIPNPLSRRGTLEEFHIASKHFGEPRRVQVYLPARYRPRRRYPLLIVHDGDDFARFADYISVLDNLIHRLEVAPLIVAFPAPGDRTTEYAADDRHAGFVAEELLPEMMQRYPLDDHPEARGLMGASFGAVASLHTAWRNPGLFGRLMLLSGSFAFSDIGPHPRGPAFDPVVEFINAFREKPLLPAQRIYLSCGVYESLIYENRSMLPLLRDTGARVSYAEARDGHNWENWRDRQRDGLSWLFRGPLWMVYE
ncbi:MAG: enterochelin esterase [Gammaproteobacteria bacterium]|nr:enterochelin esterase [Gammaproteobacteria bacterium]